MNIVSYWKEPKIIYQEGDFTLITGWYDHKNENDGGDKALGVHWGYFPESRNMLCPCVIPAESRDAILAGLLHKAASAGEAEAISTLTEAVVFFQD